MSLVELIKDDIVHINRIVVADAVRRGHNQFFALSRPDDLESCLGGIFYRDQIGIYWNEPFEKMAGVLLFRIAQGQFFVDGNKRTGLLSCHTFIERNGHRVWIDHNEVNGLLWGFGDVLEDGSKRKTEEDAIQWVYDNIL